MYPSLLFIINEGSIPLLFTSNIGGQELCVDHLSLVEEVTTVERFEKQGFLYAGIAVAIWSGFILVSRLGGVSELTPYDVIAVRYLTCTLLLIPAWIYFRVSLLKPELLICSMVGGLAYALFVFNGFAAAPASHAAVLLPGLMPLFILMLSMIVLGELLSVQKLLGILVISLGVASLFWGQLQQDNQLTSGHLWLVLGSFCWAIYSVLLKLWSIGPLQAAISLAFYTSLVYLPVYFFLLPSNISFDSFDLLWEDILLQAFYQGFMASVVQMVVYVRAVQLIGPSSMGAMMANVPVIAGIAAVVMFNEAFSITLLMGLICVSLGAWIVHTKLLNRRLGFI